VLFVATGWVTLGFKGDGPHFVKVQYATIFFGETEEEYTWCGAAVEPLPGFRLWFDYEPEPPAGLVLWWVQIPLWVPCLLIGAPAVLLWRIDAKRRLAAPGRCVRCGYDRAGLSKDTTCPECGTAPATEPSAQPAA
jgi:hypothetical protein